MEDPQRDRQAFLAGDRDMLFDEVHHQVEGVHLWRVVLLLRSFAALTVVRGIGERSSFRRRVGGSNDFRQVVPEQPCSFRIS